MGNCTIQNYWCVDYPTDEDFHSSSYHIKSGQYSSGSYPSSFSKVEIKTTSTSFYQSTKLVVKATIKANASNPYACQGFLSASDLDGYSVASTNGAMSYYGPSSTLNDSKIASSYAYTDSAGQNSAGSSASSGTTIYYVFNTTGLRADTTYYLYFLRHYKCNGGCYANIESIDLSYTSYITLSSPSITTDLGTIVPKSSLNISWGSVANASSYSLTLQDGNGQAIATSGNINDTSYTATISSPDNYRGHSLKARVTANGTGQYKSSTKEKIVAVFNSLPNKPTVSQSSTELTPQTSIKFTVTKGSDAQTGQTLELYYLLNPTDISGNTKTKFSNELTITTTSTQGGRKVIGGENKVYFFTYDGLEYSDYTEATFQTYLAPIFSNKTLTTDFTYVKNMSGASNTLVSKVNLGFNLQGNNSVTGVEVYLKTGSSTSNLVEQSEPLASGYTFNNSTNTIEIPVVSLSSIEPAHYFSFAIKVKNASGTSELSNWTTAKRKPQVPSTPTVKTISTDRIDSSLAADGYYSDYVNLTWNQAEDNTRAQIVERWVIITFPNQSNKEPEKIALTGSLDLDNKVVLNLGVYVNTSVRTTLSFRVVDEAGQMANSDSFADFTRAPALAFTGEIGLSEWNLRPLTNKIDFVITHPVANRGNASQVSYLYKVDFDGKSVRLEIQDTWIVKTSDVLFTITIPSNYINQLLKDNASNTDISYDANIVVTAYDGFNSTVSLSTTQSQFKINFTEPPVFVYAWENQYGKPKLKHDYYTASSSFTKDTGILVPENKGNENLDLRMFCLNEGVIFVLPKATDPNNDIAQYEIYLSRNNFIKESEVLDYNQVTFESNPRIVIPIGDLTVQDNYYYYYRHSLSQYTKNEYLYYQVVVKDSTGNTSEPRTCPTYFIGSRTVSPKFSSGSVTPTQVKTSAEGQSYNSQVNLNFSFKITDLGGSATNEGWRESYYKNFPNFERSITGYSPKASLLIEVAPNQDFNSNETYSRTYDFVPGSGQSLLDFKLAEATISNVKTELTKIFMRFTLTVSYGLQNSGTLATITSVPQVYTYFGSVPTMAHRVHKVGINTTSLDQDDVLVVENYQGTKYVRFKGTDAFNASKTYEITFDLLTGSITGAVIDCGSW